MQATKFEFKHRFWVISGIYFFGFALSGIDRAPFIVALRHLIAPSIVRDSPEAACKPSHIVAGQRNFRGGNS